MAISRRSFLRTVTACSSLMPWPGFAPAGFDPGLARRPFESSGAVLVDSGEACLLPESLAGYEDGLRVIGSGYTRATAESVPFSPLILVPGLAGGATALTRKLRTFAQHGSVVVIESGAIFQDGPEFEDHRRLLRDDFSVGTEVPVALCEDQPQKQISIGVRGAGEFKRPGGLPLEVLPYIDFLWPIQVKIRDFSRAIPVSVEGGEVVAISGFSVAVRKCMGRGSVVFLGSPAGPSILAADSEARNWLYAVLAQGVRN
jgi:hypothetical protein